MSKTVKGSAATPGAASPGLITKKAADLLPKLNDSAFEVSNVQQLPTGGAGQEHVTVFFRKPADPSLQARAEVYLLPQVDTAKATFKSATDAYTSPPPGADIPGPNTQAKAPGTADDAQGFVTAKPDSKGTLVWSDIYRFGNVVYILSVQGKDGPDAAALRQTLAERMAAAVK